MTANDTSERHDWTVTGMDCSACSTKITTALERLPGVADVQVGVMSERLSLRLEAGTTGREAVETTVKKLGLSFRPSPPVTMRRMTTRAMIMMTMSGPILRNVISARPKRLSRIIRVTAVRATVMPARPKTWTSTGIRPPKGSS